MTLLTSSSRKGFHTFLINNVDQLKSREITRFSPAAFYITRQARQLSTASALCGRFYNGSATSKQLLRSSGINVSLTLVKKTLIFLALHILRFLKLLQFKKKIGVVKRQIDQEIARLKKLEEKPKKEMSLLQYYKLNAIKRPEFKQRIALVLAKITELKGCGLLLTKIRINDEATALKIYWSTKSADQEKKKIIAEILKNKHSQFLELVRKDLGQLPNCEFVLDDNYNWQKSVNAVLDSIGDSLTLNEDENKESIMDQLSNIKLGDSIHSNMSRDAIIKQLTYAQEKESGQLKIDMEQIKKFKDAYNHTILYHGAEDKKETKYNIKKFLQQRNALPRGN